MTLHLYQDVKILKFIAEKARNKLFSVHSPKLFTFGK